jgi:hypothetical protein
MKRFIIEKSDDEFYTSHSGLALVGLGVNRYTSLNAKLRKAMSDIKDISNTDVIRSYIGLLSLGKSDFEAVAGMKDDKYFQESLGIKRVPSPETLRQRLDETAAFFQPIVSSTFTEFIRNAKGRITPLSMGHVAVDMDVFCMDNSGTRKEGSNHTYHGYDGYAPVGAYMGEEGWCINLEFREGSQHSQNNFIPFLNETISRAKSLTKKPLLFRLDSAHDAVETRGTLYEPKKVDYILKWNPRKQDLASWLERGLKEGEVSEPRPGKRVALFSFNQLQEHNDKEFSSRLVVRVIERTVDKRGQMLLTPDIQLEGWWTSLYLPEQEIIKLYQGHGTSEQFHSEFKTDMDLERLPSGKFATNSLIMSLAGLTYNILRFIGQLGLLGDRSPVRHPAKRRRIRTVIQELMYRAARLIETGRKLKLRFSRHCSAFDAFHGVYNRLAYG